VQLPELRLMDLGSTNGTFVNGSRVAPPVCPTLEPEGDPRAATVAYPADPAGWHPLEAGDVIALAGNIVLRARVQPRDGEGKPPAGRRQRRGGAGQTPFTGRLHDHLALSPQG